MKEITKEDVERALLHSGFVLKLLEDTVVIEPSRPCLLLSIKHSPSDLARTLDLKQFGKSEFYLIGRETGSPFQSNDGTFPPGIPRARCLLLENPEELSRVLIGLDYLRKDVGNDFYIIPSNGTFLVYASHHDEILLYLPTDSESVPSRR